MCPTVFEDAGGDGWRYLVFFLQERNKSRKQEKEQETALDICKINLVIMGLTCQTQVIWPIQKGLYLQDIIFEQIQIMKISRLGLSVWCTGGAKKSHQLLTGFVPLCLTHHFENSLSVIWKQGNMPGIRNYIIRIQTRSLISYHVQSIRSIKSCLWLNISFQAWIFPLDLPICEYLIQ